MNSHIVRPPSRFARLGRAVLIATLAVTGLAISPAAPTYAANSAPAGNLAQNQQYTFTLAGTTCSVTYVYGNYAGRGYSSIRMNSGNCTRVTTRATNSNGTSYWNSIASTGQFGRFAQATPAAASIINADFCVEADGGFVRSRFAVNAFTTGGGTTSGSLGQC